MALEDGYDIRTIQEPLAHSSVRTAIIGREVSLTTASADHRDPYHGTMRRKSPGVPFRVTGRPVVC